MSAQTHELLSRADIVRQYRYPKSLLDQDITTGRLPSFSFGTYYASRVYVPRYAVEARIEELAGAGQSVTMERAK